MVWKVHISGPSPIERDSQTAGSDGGDSGGTETDSQSESDTVTATATASETQTATATATETETCIEAVDNQVFMTNLPAGEHYGMQSTLGYYFIVGPYNVSVTHVGVFDFAADGLADDHEVRIWDEFGMPIAEGMVPSGISQYQDGFQYAELDEPVVLEADKRYVIGAWYPSGDDEYRYWIRWGDTPPTVPDCFVLETALRETEEDEMSFPDTYQGAGTVGPNFIFSPMP